MTTDPATTSGGEAGIRGRFPLASLAFFVLAAVVHTWPLASDPGVLSRNDTSDTVHHEWIIAWVVHQLTTDPVHLFDTNTFHPERDTLAYSENNIVAGVLGLPAYLLTGNPYATHNLSVVLGIALAFVCGYGLLRYLTHDTGAAIAGGIVVPYQDGVTGEESQTYNSASGGWTIGWSAAAGIFVTSHLAIEGEWARSGEMTSTQPSRYDMTFHDRRRDRFLSFVARFPLSSGAVRVERLQGVARRARPGPGLGMGDEAGDLHALLP